MKDGATRPTNEFREYIQNLRKQRGLTLRQAAKKAGIDPSGLLGIENGRTVHSPRPETLNGLARAYDVPLAELLSRVGYDITPPDMRAYLRGRYSHLSEKAINAACDYIERLAAEHNIEPNGPGDHEDELQTSTSES
jgi:transcriptional regulator with XRE-family HTH domain